MRRHGDRPAYRAHDADRQAWVSALRPKRCLLAMNRRLRDIVASKLILDWSPEQISGWLKSQYPDDESMRVSHETVYRSLFIQARGVLKKELMDYLRSKRHMRRSRHASVHGHGRIIDAISIRERPAEGPPGALPPARHPRPQPGRPPTRTDPHPPALGEGQRVHAHPDSY